MSSPVIVKYGFSLFFSCLVAAGAFAQESAEADAPQKAQVDTRNRNSRILYEIDAESRVTYTWEGQVQVLREAALNNEKTTGIGYSRSVQEAEILEAWTQKADGRRIDAPPGNYQTSTQTGYQGNNPFFSDRAQITVVFPDLAVGDTTGGRIRVRDTEALFPGKVSFSHFFSQFSAWDNATLEVRAPENMALRFEAHHLEALPDTVENGFITRRWRYHNPEPRVWDEEKDEGIWRYEENPVLFVSNFGSYAEIAEAYGARALPKAEPTERIRKLAAEIVGTTRDRREQARKLYEWVSEKISYAGNCIGIGTVVPRDLDVVLDNNMGDCKDQATLLQALFSAQGIASEQALISAGTHAYDLPVTPSVWAVNHVMNYLPEWNLYVDATASEIPFGYLPANTYGKPVVHVGVPDAVRVVSGKDAPVPQARKDVTLRLAADGSVSGEAKFWIKGVEAAETRGFLMQLKDEDKEKFVERTLQGLGLRGKGKLLPLDLAPEKRLSDELSVGFSFQAENFLHNRSGAFSPIHFLAGDEMTLKDFSEIDTTKKQQRDVDCYNLKVEEHYDFILEPGVRLVELPEALTHRSPGVDYRASVTRTPKGVRFDYTLTDKSPLGVCAPEVFNAWLKDVTPVVENLQQQVLYKREAARAKLNTRAR